MALKEEIRYSLFLARKKERKFKTDESTYRVCKLIYQLKLLTNKEEAIRYLEKKRNDGYKI